VDFIYFDAGGGHRSAALALKSVIDRQERGWDVRLLNLQEALDPLDVFRKVLGIRLQDVYNTILSRGWTLGSRYLLPPMHGIIRLYHRSQVRLLTSLWQQRRPDLVVSLVPNFNRALFESLRAALPGVPLVTVMTDFADYPPHFWIEKQAQYLICGTPKAVQQAHTAGHPPERIFEVSGMILRPQFYDVRPPDCRDARAALGLSAKVPTGCLLFGGAGSPVMREITMRLGNSPQDLQLIVICGRNEPLFRELSALRTRNRIHVEGFTQDIPRLMSLCDFFIGKPGPGSISEAVHMNLPVIVERNAWTLPQERYNTDWVREHQVGVVLPNLRRIDDAVGQLLSGDELARMKEATRQLRNRAVFEIPEILAKLLAAAEVPDSLVSH
jgi:UDP-N-acetylglucosamine:LPS N-acetylglucosamine transferase